MTILSIFKMAAAAILDFADSKFLSSALAGQLPSVLLPLVL